MEHFDLIILGAGINGVSIAVDACSRGLKTLVVDQSGAGAGASTLIPIMTRGFRHMEYYELGLVRRCLTEARILSQRAPSLVTNQPCFFPYPASHERAFKRAFQLYKWIGRFSGQRMPGQTHYADRHGVHMVEQICDSRGLLFSSIALAEQLNCAFRYQHKVSAANPFEGRWTLNLVDHEDNQHIVSSRAVVNASGVGSIDISETIFGYPSRCAAEDEKLYFVTCDYDVDPKQLYILTQAHRRGLVVMPQATDSTNHATQWLIGGIAKSSHKEEETLSQVNRLLTKYDMPQIPLENVHSEFYVPHVNFLGRCMRSTMDHMVELICPDGKHPLLNVIGGTSTTSRYLAEQAINSLSDYLPVKERSKTAYLPLPRA